MAREKFQTLTEQMFYILLCLQRECCGVDVMDRVARMTENRVTIGPGTLYRRASRPRASFRRPGWRDVRGATRSPGGAGCGWRRRSSGCGGRRRTI